MRKKEKSKRKKKKCGEIVFELKKKFKKIIKKFKSIRLCLFYSLSSLSLSLSFTHSLSLVNN